MPYSWGRVPIPVCGRECQVEGCAASSVLFGKERLSLLDLTGSRRRQFVEKRAGLDVENHDLESVSLAQRLDELRQ